MSAEQETGSEILRKIYTAWIRFWDSHGRHPTAVYLGRVEYLAIRSIKLPYSVLSITPTGGDSLYGMELLCVNRTNYLEVA